jgi:nuclear pore complex protein Nup160
MAKYYCHIVAVYEKQKAYSYVIEFARLAIQFAQARDDEGAVIRTELLSRQFHAAVALSRFDVAHASMLSISVESLQHACLRKLVEKMCDGYHNIGLVSLPFPGLEHAVEEILEEKCQATMDVVHGIPYHQILYSWRVNHNNYRGAAAILYDRIQKLRHAGEGDKFTGEDVLDTPVTKQYVLLINALTCLETKDRFIIPQDLPHPGQRDGDDDGKAKLLKRKLVTLEDIRKQYQDELDRIAAIQNNQFGFEADDMEIL